MLVVKFLLLCFGFYEINATEAGSPQRREDGKLDPKSWQDNESSDQGSQYSKLCKENGVGQGSIKRTWSEAKRRGSRLKKGDGLLYPQKLSFKANKKKIKKRKKVKIIKNG